MGERRRPFPGTESGPVEPRVHQQRPEVKDPFEVQRFAHEHRRLVEDLLLASHSRVRRSFAPFTNAAPGPEGTGQTGVHP